MIYVCDCGPLDARIFRCMDCKGCTNCAYEYYMVHDEVWHQANPKDRGMLCIGCLELRLDRLLTKDDFTPAPINQIAEIVGSTRIKNRLQKVAGSATV